MELSMRWPLKFTIRAIGVLVAIVAISTSFGKRQVQTQDRVVKQVEALGGYVRTVSFAQDREVLIHDRPEWIPRFLYPITPMALNYVCLTGVEIGDRELASVIELPNLAGLNLCNSDISDRGLRMLMERTQLLELQICNVDTVSEKAIEEFKIAHPRCHVVR